MTVLASVQQAADTVPMTFGRLLTMLGAFLIVAAVLCTSGVGMAWLISRLENRTRYDEVEDTYPVERIPAGRSWE